MALIHNNVTLFGNHTHSNIIEGPYDKRMQIGQWVGLSGESHLTDPAKGRTLWCEVDALNYSSRAQVTNAVTALQNYASQSLFGTLRIIYPGNTYDDFVNCTLEYVTKDPEGTMYEASNGTYRTKVTFTWRQAN